MMRFLDGEQPGELPFAAPFVKVDGAVVSQTANILAYLAPRFGLVPDDEALRAEASQIQLTIADFVGEIHDTHHPIAGSLYYEDQKKEARRRAQNFLKERMPRYLGWLEDVLARNEKSRGRWLALIGRLDGDRRVSVHEKFLEWSGCPTPGSRSRTRDLLIARASKVPAASPRCDLDKAHVETLVEGPSDPLQHRQ